MSSHAWDDAQRSGGDDPTVSGPVAMLLAAVAFGLAAQHLFFDRAAGANVLVATGLLLGIAWAARPPGRRPDVADLWLAPAALTFAAWCAIRVDVEASAETDASTASGADAARTAQTAQHSPLPALSSGVPETQTRAGHAPRRGPNWYRGDLHAHSIHSDAAWDIPDLLNWAHERGLDFATLKQAIVRLCAPRSVGRTLRRVSSNGRLLRKNRLSWSSRRERCGWPATSTRPSVC